ncbi:MAG: DUF1501 domain-containing protein [Verrucomicrobia bacterium]|nr:DUF1501 domain-containing protein [Verrucomicrobiota bacterium]
MLTITGRPGRPLCDGMARRDFLRIGGLAMGGLSMPQILQAEAMARVGHSAKSIIMIYMAGAPPHQDLFDLKMDAPLDYRGPYSPISTKVPGIRISEHMPYSARIMDKLVPIRSMVGSVTGDHDSQICYTGRSAKGVTIPPGGWPSLGAVMSKFQPGGKATSSAVPPFVGLAPKAGHPPYGSPGHPGFLGPACSAFRPNGEGIADLRLNGISSDRLGDRRALLTAFDKMRRDVDKSGLMEGLDVFNRQAFDVLSSSRLLEALDLSKESPKTRERYGKGDTRNYGDGAPRNNEHFLVARRLVEAGARCVTMNYGRWDFHDRNHAELLTHLPWFDQGFSALVEDLHERGLDKDVAVVAWGEFGRTPRLNATGGRDHWPRVGCAVLAGGGFKTGQVIGATDRLGGEPTERPVHFGEVFATLYHWLGLDLVHTTLPDLSGRPQYLVDGWQPMKELI